MDIECTLRAVRRIGLLLIPVLLAAGTDPKPKADDYPVSAKLDGFELGAEYFARSIPCPDESLFSGKFLVVEVAVYPAKGKTVEVRGGQFRLRFNGTKREMPPTAAGWVASSLKYEDWDSRRRMEATAGIGDAEVVLGRPNPQERYPGDTSGNPRRGPSQPKAPEGNTDVTRPPAKTAPEAVNEYAFYEGEDARPRAGLFYFPWSSKLKDIKTLDLIYDGPGGRTVLKLK